MNDASRSCVSSVPVYEVRRVRLIEVREKCDHPDAAAVIAKRELRGLDRERVLAIYVNAQNAVMGFETVAIGFENGCGATLTTLFRGAILAGAKAIIVAHNHPSGELVVSAEDRELLVAAKAAGKVIGCPLIDFLIIADDGRHIGMEVVELGGP